MKIICTQGLPAAGKTTWSKQFIEDNPEFKRVNKDDIRLELGLPFSKKNEEIVIKTERKRVENYLKLGHSVVVDNTHLIPRFKDKNKHISFYRELAENYNVEFEVKTFVISVAEAIERDSKRENPLGKKVLKRFKQNFQIPSKYPVNPTFVKYNKELNNCIICDLDGTLAFMDNKRSPYDYSKVGGDRINGYLETLIKSTCNSGFGGEVVFLSGRDEDCREETMRWLRKNGFFHYSLFMRKAGDKRKDNIVKKELYEENIKGKCNVVAVFDDRNQVVDMWREIGLPTYQVWYGDF